MGYRYCRFHAIFDDEMDVVVDIEGGTSNRVRPNDQYKRQAEDDNGMILDGPSDPIITKKKVRKTSCQHETDDDDFILRGEKPLRGRGRLKASGAVVMDLSQEHASKHDAQLQFQLQHQHGDNHPYVTNLTDSPSFGHISLLEYPSAEDDALDLIDVEKKKLQIHKRKRGVKSSKISTKKISNKDTIQELSSGSAEGGEQGEGQGDGEASTPSPSHSPNLDRSKVLYASNAL